MVKKRFDIVSPFKQSLALSLAALINPQIARAQSERAATAEVCTVDPTIWQLEFEADAVEATAGERVALRWSKTNGRFGEYLAPECLSDWVISDPALATLDPDRRAITISGNVEADRVVTVSVRFKNQSASAAIRIRGKDEPILVGLWARTGAENCLKAPVELWFGRNGRFSYTFAEHMIETMQSGSGTYIWNWRTGSVALARMNGKALRSGAILVTEGLEFGLARASPNRCKITWQLTAAK